jgi:hypothetical protein
LTRTPVGARGLGGAVQTVVAVAGEGDQASERMRFAELPDGRDPVELGHVQVDDDRVRSELLGQPERLEAVVSQPDHGQLGLLFDQVPQRCRVGLVVIGEQDTDSGVVPGSELHVRTTPAIASPG